MMDEYEKSGRDGYRAEFHDGVACSARDVEVFGSGEGRRFQEMCKRKPEFAVNYAALLLRHMGGGKQSHWGPIRRREVEIRKEAFDLFTKIRSEVEKEVSS
jgi:hypothetical protein